MVRLRYVGLLLLSMAAGSTWAQPGTSSPYSLSGMGELRYSGFVDQFLTGGTSIAFRDRDNFSMQNPASYSALRSTVYNAGASFSSGTLDDGITQSKTENGNFNYFGLGFATPYEKDINWGLSLGFRQLTDVGYRIRANNQDSLDTYNRFEGLGGLSNLHMGFGIEPMKNLSVGINYNYIFGTVHANTFHVIPRKSHFSFYDHSEIYYRGGNWDLGVQYTIQSGSLTHVLGGTFRTKTNLTGRGLLLTQTFFGALYDGGGFIPIDTIRYQEDLQRDASLPSQFGFGYSLQGGQGWGLSVEWEKANWSSITNPLDGEPYHDNMRYGLGVWVIPNPDYTLEGNFLAKLRYSAGVHYQELFYRYFNQPIDEFGMRFGIGIPVVRTFQSRQGKIPMINRVNIGFDYLKRGSGTNNLIQETYYGLQIGLNFNDKWFIKRKYQ